MIKNLGPSHQDLVKEAAELRQENAELQQRLEEAEQTLDAIRNGEVDALVVDTKLGQKIFTLEGADTVYRTAIENISEGTITISSDGTILYSNNYFAQMMHADLNKVIGSSIFNFVRQENRGAISSIFLQESTHNEISFVAHDGVQIPTLLSTKKIQLDIPTICAVITDLTQQKRNEEIITEARLLQSILTQSTEAVIVCDANGTIIHTSMEAQKLVGHFTVGSTFDKEFKFLKIDDYPITLSALRAGKIANQTEINIVSEGNKKTFLIAHAKLGVDDVILGHVITLTDITKIKQSEAALSESEERFRSVLENSNDVIYRVDLHTGRYEYISPSAEEVTGYSPAELIAQDTKAALGMVHPEDVMVLANAIKGLGDTGHATADYRQCTKNGKYRWLSNRMALVKNNHGQPLYRIGNIRDITENKKIENALRESEAKYRLLVSSVKDYAIFMLDPSGIVVSWNEGAKNIKGYDTEEIIGKHFSRFYTSDDTKADKPNRDLMIALTEGRFEEEGPRVRKDGSIFQAKVIITPIKDMDGRLAGYSKVVQDITSRKMAEEDLKKKEVDLEEVNKELEAFSYSVSHDLRAPLRSLAGFSSILLEDYAGKLDDEGKLYLFKIQESSESMAQLIDDLLKLARVGRTEINYEKLNLSEMARTSIKELQSNEPQRKVKVIIEPNLVADGDRTLIHRVLDNLLGNAWKFSSKVPQPQIEVGFTEHDGKQTYFIRDNGAGFNMNYSDKLFKPFQRLHAASDYTGTGIGLAIAQRIIRRHGGEIWAEGKVGEGATFYFTLS